MKRMLLVAPAVLGLVVVPSLVAGEPVDEVTAPTTVEVTTTTTTTTVVPPVDEPTTTLPPDDPVSDPEPAPDLLPPVEPVAGLSPECVAAIRIEYEAALWWQQDAAEWIAYYTGPFGAGEAVDGLASRLTDTAYDYRLAIEGIAAWCGVVLP